MNGLFYIARRFKVATALNLLGLAAALTACYVLRTQVEFATEYNRSIQGGENVYRVEVSGILSEDLSAWVTRAGMERVARLPRVEQAAILSRGTASTLWQSGEELVEITGWKMNNELLRCFPPRMICGVDSLANEMDALLPRSMSMKMFGTEMSVGQHFKTSEGERTVVGVFEDFPENCSMKNVMYVSVWDENANNEGNWNYQGFLKLRDTTELEAFAESLLFPLVGIPENLTDEERAHYEKQLEGMSVHLRPITDTYSSRVDTEDKGSPAMVMILQIACWLMLIVAAINFANFTLAETPMRIKGVNTRKVLGMTNGELRRGMILETVMTALAAFVLAVGMAYLLNLAPWMQAMVNGSIALADNLHLIIYGAVASLLIGVLVGLYPAFYATSFPPALVLKGSFGLSPRGVLLRKTLVCVQLFVAFFLAIYLGVLFLQKNHIFSSDYGFAKDEIVFTEHITRSNNFDKYRTQLEAIPGVESVAFAQSIPGISDVIMRWGRPIDDGKEADFTVLVCDWKFPRTMGIEIVEGRDFGPQDSDCYIFNETAKRDFPWLEVDKRFSSQDMPVIGFCKNFQAYTKRRDNDRQDVAMIVFGELFKSWRQPYRIVARIGKNVDKIATMKTMHETLASNFPAGYPVPEFRFIDEELQQTYEEEFRFIRQVEVFSLLCLLITLVGVFCLTMFETEYRRREIGIRKVLGNSTRDIVLMFSRRYLLLILTAFVLASPLAWKMSGDWLENFAERTPIPLWLFPLALLAVSAVVLATVAVQTWRAARESPVKAIKSE